MNNKAKVLTNLSIISGLLGVLSWLIGGVLQFSGGVWIFPFWHWWTDGAFLLLIAVWLKLGAIYHKQ